MLTGKHLGAAIKEAIQRKGVSQAAVARHFKVTPPSVQEWISKGVIKKDRLQPLWRYFESVAGPEHWGLEQFPWDTVSEPRENAPEWGAWGSAEPTRANYAPSLGTAGQSPSIHEALQTLDDALRKLGKAAHAELLDLFPMYLANPTLHAATLARIEVLLLGEFPSSSLETGSARGL